MDSISKVLQRINMIERRFGNSMVQKLEQPVSFTEMLQNAEKNSNHNPALQTEVGSLVQQTAIKHGVNPKLALAVARAESDFNPAAVSPAGAIGVMQLMPETARSLGVKNVHDVNENVDGGVRYLKQMLNTFNGDVSQAVAAYNAGPEAVKRYHGIPPYQETQTYVAKIMNNLRDNAPLTDK
jgi:soluble lytic murein transglycosylase-like protein